MAEQDAEHVDVVDTVSWKFMGISIKSDDIFLIFVLLMIFFQAFLVFTFAFAPQRFPINSLAYKKVLSLIIAFVHRDMNYCSSNYNLVSNNIYTYVSNVVVGIGKPWL